MGAATVEASMRMFIDVFAIAGMLASDVGFCNWNARRRVGCP